MKKMMLLVFACLAFAPVSLAKDEHDHKMDKKWHCEKKTDGKVVELKDVKTRIECKQKGGKWTKGHKHDEKHGDEKGHSEDDGHEHK